MFYTHRFLHGSLDLISGIRTRGFMHGDLDHPAGGVDPALRVGAGASLGGGFCLVCLPFVRFVLCVSDFVFCVQGVCEGG